MQLALPYQQRYNLKKASFVLADAVYENLWPRCKHIPRVSTRRVEITKERTRDGLPKAHTHFEYRAIDIDSMTNASAFIEAAPDVSILPPIGHSF